MKWPQELDRLLPLTRKYRQRYWLFSVLKIITLLAMVNISLQIVGGLTSSGPSYGFIFISTNVVALGVGLIYFYKKRPGEQEVAVFLDTQLDSKERITTFLEYQQQKGHVISAMRDEVKEFVSKVKLSFDWDSKNLKRQWLTALGMIIILMACVMVSPMISESIERNPDLDDQKKEIIEDLDELIEELIEIDQEKYEELIKELEILETLIQEARSMEELELLLKEVEELILQELETLDNVVNEVSEIQDLLNSPQDLEQELKDNPLFREELLKRLENLENQNLNSSELERLQGLREELEGNAGPSQQSLNQLKGLLEEVNNNNHRAPLQNRVQRPSQGEGNEGNGQSEGNEGNGQQGNGGDSGEGNNGENGQNGNTNSGNSGGGSSSTGGDTSSPEDFVYIPRDQELVLEGGEGEYTLRDIMKMNPEIISSPYSDVYTGYHKDAITSMNGSDIPKPLEAYVRNYFRSIAP